MNPTLFWFYSPDCEYCIRLDPEVREFAQAKSFNLIVEDRPIRDEDGVPQVPALACSHPKTSRMIFYGSFCLDALRYHLYG